MLKRGGLVGDDVVMRLLEEQLEDMISVSSGIFARQYKGISLCACLLS
jgi:hypothetical protein